MATEKLLSLLAHVLLCRFRQGVIPRYGEVLDEMATGVCIALEVRRHETTRIYSAVIFFSRVSVRAFAVSTKTNNS